MKIYTKTGDTGTTSLASGRRVSKDELLIEAYGTVDELNSFIGLLIVELQIESANEQLLIIQNLLFNIGSLLAKDQLKMKEYPSISLNDITTMEGWIDEWDKVLSPLANFILPGGNKSMAIAHICRTICRRAERRVVALQGEVEDHELITQYLNRLSDYFFIMARVISKKEDIAETLWNKNRQS